MQRVMQKVDVAPNVVWLLMLQDATIPCMRRECRESVTRQVLTVDRIAKGEENYHALVSLTEPSLFTFCDRHTKARGVHSGFPVKKKHRAEFEAYVAKTVRAVCFDTELDAEAVISALTADTEQ